MNVSESGTGGNATDGNRTATGAAQVDVRSSFQTYFLTYVLCFLIWRTFNTAKGWQLGRPHAKVPLNTAAAHYLVFMKYTERSFRVLSIISLIEFGVVPYVRNESTTKEIMLTLVPFDLLGSAPLQTNRPVEETMIWTLVKGCVVLFFMALAKVNSDVPIPDDMSDVIERTVWLKRLPVADKQMYCGKFDLTDVEFKHVEKDIALALTNYIRNPPDDSRLTFKYIMDQLCGAGDAAQAIRRQGRQGRLTKLARSISSISSKPLLQDLEAESVVERIHVAPVTDQWCSLSLAYLDARERRQVLVKQDDVNPTFLDCLNRGAKSRQRRARDSWTNKEKKLKSDLQKWIAGEKMLSGSAFVTFKKKEDRDKILGESIFMNSFPYFLIRSYNFFSFGRPPFSEVTLRTTRAPHPSDIIWKNIHWTWNWRIGKFVGHVFILFFFMLVIATPVSLLSSLQPLLEWSAREADTTRNQYIEPWLGGQNISGSSWHHKLLSGTDELSNILMLVINTMLLPFWIYLIASWIKPLRHSSEELLQLHLNYFFLLLNAFLLPMLGAASIQSLVHKFIQSGRFDLDVTLIDNAFWDSPIAPKLILQYLLSTAFVTNGTQLLQTPQRLYRWWALRSALTDSDIRDATNAWPFAWGWWYAWALNNMTMALFLSEMAPSVIPCCCIFFMLKHYADRYNLEHAVYDMGAENEGLFIQRVATYVKAIVYSWWITMSIIGWLHMSGDDDDKNRILDKSVWRNIFMLIGALSVCGLSAAWFSHVVVLQREAFQADHSYQSWLEMIVKHFFKPPQLGRSSSQSREVFQSNALEDLDGPPWDGAWPVMVGYGQNMQFNLMPAKEMNFKFPTMDGRPFLQQVLEEGQGQGKSYVDLGSSSWDVFRDPKIADLLNQKGACACATEVCPSLRQQGGIVQFTHDHFKIECTWDEHQKRLEVGTPLKKHFEDIFKERSIDISALLGGPAERPSPTSQRSHFRIKHRSGKLSHRPDKDFKEEDFPLTVSLILNLPQSLLFVSSTHKLGLSPCKLES